MLRAVATVIVLVLICGYVALFLSWNATPRPIVTLQLGGTTYEQAMPVGFLFVIGVLVGSIVMAIALWGPWNALKANEAQQRELIQRARTRLKAQEDKIRELTQALEASALRASAATDTGLSPEAQAAVKEVEASVATSASDAPAAQGAASTSESDSEVI